MNLLEFHDIGGRFVYPESRIVKVYSLRVSNYIQGQYYVVKLRCEKAESVT
jgi:hypothetical protein